MTLQGMFGFTELNTGFPKTRKYLSYNLYNPKSFLTSSIRLIFQTNIIIHNVTYDLAYPNSLDSNLTPSSISAFLLNINV